MPAGAAAALRAQPKVAARLPYRVHPSRSPKRWLPAGTAASTVEAMASLDRPRAAAVPVPVVLVSLGIYLESRIQENPSPSSDP